MRRPMLAAIAAVVMVGCLTACDVDRQRTQLLHLDEAQTSEDEIDPSIVEANPQLTLDLDSTRLLLREETHSVYVASGEDVQTEAYCLAIVIGDEVSTGCSSGPGLRVGVLGAPDYALAGHAPEDGEWIEVADYLWTRR